MIDYVVEPAADGVEPRREETRRRLIAQAVRLHRRTNAFRFPISSSIVQSRLTRLGVRIEGG